MMRGVLCSLFVMALGGTALAQESPVQVVDKPAATETAAPKATKTKSHKAKHKAKHKARKHKKSTRHGKASTHAPTPE